MKESWTIQITKNVPGMPNSALTKINVTEEDFERALEMALAYVEDRHDIPIKLNKSLAGAT